MTLYQYPAIAAGDRVVSSTLTGMETVFIAKGTSTSRTATTILDDPDLTFPVVANGIYFVEFGIYYDGVHTTAPSTGDITTKWNTPSGSSGLKAVLGPGSAALDGAADNISGRFGVHGYTIGVTYSCARNSTSQQWAYENSVITVGETAGNVTLQWGQGFTAATATIVSGNAWGRMARLQ